MTLLYFYININLKAESTFSNCQRQVSSLYPNMHKIKPVKIQTQSVIKVVSEIMKEETPLLHRIVRFQMPEKGFMHEVRL